MASQPTVSVIVPIYNTEQYLNECIESLVAQTYQPLEIVLVDDGSTDSSGVICDNYAKKYANIVVLHTANQGRTNARITGVEMAKGEYVSFVDADDYVAATYIEYLVNCILEYKVEVSCCDCLLFDAKREYRINRTHFGKFDAEDLKRFFENDFLFDERVKVSSVAHYLCCKLFKKDTIRKSLPVGKDLWDGEDVVTLYHLLQKTKSIFISNEPLYFYRQYEGQTTRIMDRKRWNALVRLFTVLESVDKNNYLAIQLPLYIFGKLRDWLKARFSVVNSYDEFKRDMIYALNPEIMDTHFIRAKISSSSFYYRILICFAQNRKYKSYYLLLMLREKVINLLKS